MPASLHFSDERANATSGRSAWRWASSAPGGLTIPNDLALSALADHKAEVYFAGTDAVFELNDEYALPNDTYPYGMDVGR